MSTPPNQPDRDKPSTDKLTLSEQLDALLIQIEETEPGTLEPEMLPQSARLAAYERLAAVEESDTPDDSDDSDDSGDSDDSPAQATALDTMAPLATATPQAADQAPPASAEPQASPEQADMLASLSSALQGLGSAPPPDQPAASTEPAKPTPAASPDDAASMQDKLQAEIASLMNGQTQADPQQATEPKPAEPATEPDVAPDAGPAAAPDEAASMEDKLQAEIASLMNGEPPADQPQAPAPQPAAAAPAPGETANTQDKIADEIEGLLNADQAKPASDQPDQAGIDELDSMLAQEIDADEELLGDFHSVEQLTAGIQVPEQMPPSSDDAHAATARDVAAELDNQPDDLPEATFEPITAPDASHQDPFTALEQLPTTAKPNQDEHEDEHEHKQRAAMRMPDWAHWIQRARVYLLNTCFVLNWPARRFLTIEWRANLGYIALLNLFFGVGLWIVLILFT